MDRRTALVCGAPSPLTRAITIELVELGCQVYVRDHALPEEALPVWGLSRVCLMATDEEALLGAVAGRAGALAVAVLTSGADDLVGSALRTLVSLSHRELRLVVVDDPVVTAGREEATETARALLSSGRGPGPLRRLLERRWRRDVR